MRTENFGAQTLDAMNIRQYRPSDQLAIDSIQADSQQDLSANTPSGFFNDLSDIPLTFKGGSFLVAEISGEVVGFGGLLPTGEIIRMRVASGHRRNGIASRLLARLVESASQLGLDHVHLHTLEEQRAARELYANFGFRESDRGELHGNWVIHFEYSIRGMSGRGNS